MLQVGDKAPWFEAINQDGGIYNLDDFKGKKLVLYFYPKDNTPGCTAEACNLRDNYERLFSKGYIVVGISRDRPSTHIKFIEKHNLQFPLLSDPDATIHKAYEAWGTKKFMGRTFEGALRKTYIIDEEGIIADIITDVKTKDHASQIMKG